MQTYLPLIQAMLSEWYLFTLNNVLYAGVLATAVWLLTAMLYSIRIASIKRAKAASEKASIESLTTVQHQLQHTQEELAETTLQMEKAASAAQAETQRALTLEQLIYQRNKQIAEIIQTMATSFDLGERPLLASEDVKADLLWQQHTKVITLLIERLRAEQQTKIELQQTCQAETAKLAEKEVLLEALKVTLDTHADQLSKLESALAEQKTALQQQNNVQQVLSDTLKNFQPAVIQAAESAPVINTWQQPVQKEETPALKEPLIVQESPTIQVNEDPQATATPIEPVSTLETAAPMFADIKPKQVVEKEPYVSLDIEQQPVVPAKGSFGKIKNLFGKAKSQPVKTEPQWAVKQPDVTLPSDIEQQPDIEAPVKTEKPQGKLKDLYSKFKSNGK
ncbi:MAG: hypothetical protein QX198_05020 [Methylococcaceae bacterium]